MIILVALLSKLLVMVYVLSILNIIRHAYILINLLLSNNENSGYFLRPKSLLLLGLSIAYVITGIFTGIAL